MSFGEELKRMDPDKAGRILDRIYAELGSETGEEPSLDSYPALERMARLGFEKSRLLQARLSGEVVELPPVEADQNESELMDRFVRGVAVGVWAATAALKEYAELQEFEAGIADSSSDQK